MIKIIRAKDATKRAVAKTYSIYGMLEAKDSKHMSACISKAIKHKETTINTKSDRFYYILKGTVKVSANGKTFIANKGDIVFIPAKTKYHFSGTFDALQVLSPPFNRIYDKTWL
jgi:ethanolamine utilization protein EutQ (cupin superfamily)